MTSKRKTTQTDKDLIRRYLVWCYKTNKEDLDKIDRYFTQHRVDGYLLKDLRQSREYRSKAADPKYRKFVKEFEKYMKVKKQSADKKKFSNASQTQLSPDYQYLKNRHAAIERAIKHFLGSKELANIRNLYEEEMTGRILAAKEH